MASKLVLLIFFVSLLGFASSSEFSGISLPSSDSSKVSLALYYESLCPYCSAFIVNHLAKLFDDDLISIVDLHLSPWGNTKLRPDNVTVVCQHGAFECFLDTVEACAIDAWPKLSDHFPFILCIESLVTEHKYDKWETCYEKLNLDSKPITDCLNSGHGNKLQLQYAAETNALQPPHEYVPWVVVDGQPLYEDYEEFVSYICEAYKGNKTPNACAKYSSGKAFHRVKAKHFPRVCHKGVKTWDVLERIKTVISSWIGITGFSGISLPSSPKVSLSLYYESLCPACSYFIVNNLLKLFEDDLISIVDLHLSPWGNTNLRPDNVTAVCQHGAYECFLDTLEACAIDSWPKLNDHFPFIYCVESLVTEHKYDKWETCYEKLNLDSKPITDCLNSGHGNELQLQYAAETSALQPAHEYVPWVVVDGQPLYEDYENFISYICKAYKGNKTPSACAKYSAHRVKVKRFPRVCHKGAKTWDVL